MDFAFKHPPLLERRSIRLLQIQPGLEEGKIRCRFMDHDLDSDEDIPFEAISYTWGDPGLTKRVIVDRQRLAITSNAYDVLKSARRSGRYRVWIDAICINQEDNAEKNLQLPLMGDIYSSATQVYAWVGNAADSSSIAFPLMRELYDLFRIYTSDLGEPVPPFPGGLHGISAQGIFEYTNTVLESPAWRALREFLKRPWFRRIWVYQEVALAKSITIVCGNETIDFQYFAPVIHWMMHCDANTILHHRDNPEDFGVIKRVKSGIMYISRMHETRYNMRYKQQLLGLEDHLCEPVYWEATNPRDMIYAVLGIVDSEVPAALKPDYEKSPAEVFIEATKFTITSTQSLRILSCTGVARQSEMEGLPSWVPDYTSFMALVPSGMVGESAFNLGQDKIPKLQVRFEGSKLIARGLLLGKIQAIGPANDKTATIVDWKERNGKLMDWVDDSIKALKPIDLQFLWRTLIRDDMEGTGGTYTPAFGNCATYHAGYENWVLMTDYNRSEKWGWKRFKSSIKLISDPVKKIEEGLRYSTAMHLKTIFMRLAKISGNGDRLGIVPPGAEVGDVVCVLFGMSVPILLRKSDDNEKTFKVVGGTYVDGADVMLYRQYHKNVFGSRKVDNLVEKEFVIE